MSMSEETLRSNLSDAFDPGSGFPDPLLLSRTLAALEAAEPATRRGTVRGTSRGRSLAGLFLVNPSGPTARVVAAGLIVVLLLAAVGAFVFLQRYFLSPTPAHWSGCGGSFQCATVKVPLDYSNPGGGSIEIATIRKPATDRSHRIGSLLLGIGNPGAGVDYLRLNAVYYQSLNKRFDLVGFDQRGVGRSTPVRCLSNAQIDALNDLDTVLDDPQEKQVFIAADIGIAQACQQAAANVLPFVDTASAARDLDMIRVSLGEAKLTYLGFDHATLLGETYAHLFPAHVRALAFDGVEDPSLALTDQWLQRAAGFEMLLQA